MAVNPPSHSRLVLGFSTSPLATRREAHPVALRLDSPGLAARPRTHRRYMEASEMKRVARATATLTVAGMFMMNNAASAAEPTQSDFEACNREAPASGTPAASPGSTGGTTSGTASSPGL